jgi:hypothetical protein
MGTLEGILIVFFIFIGWPAFVIVYKSKWGNRNILYRKHHLASIEARHPYCVATKKLSEEQLIKLIKHKLPDTDNVKGAIKLLPGAEWNSLSKNNPNQLDFAILGDSSLNGRNYIKTEDGHQHPTSVRFGVIVDHDNNETIAKLITHSWTEKKGVFERYQDLTRAQDKMLELAQSFDPQADAFTES